MCKYSSTNDVTVVNKHLVKAFNIYVRNKLRRNTRIKSAIAIQWLQPVSFLVAHKLSIQNQYWAWFQYSQCDFLSGTFMFHMKVCDTKQQLFRLVLMSVTQLQHGYLVAHDYLIISKKCNLPTSITNILGKWMLLLNSQYSEMLSIHLFNTFN